MNINVQSTYHDSELEDAQKLLSYLSKTDAHAARVEVRKTAEALNAVLPESAPLQPEPQPTQPAPAPDPVKKEEATAPTLPTFEDVRKECQTFIAHKGGETFKAILEQLGAKRLSDVKPEQFPELIGAIHAN